MTYPAKNMVRPKLAASALIDVAVPPEWRSVIECLRSFESMMNAQKAGKTGHETLHDLHQKILSISAILTEHESLNCLSEKESRDIFVKAALLSSHLRATTVGKQGILDTSSSRTLSLHAADFSGSSEDTNRLKALLTKTFGVHDELWSQIKLNIEQRITQTKRKEHITDELRSMFNLDPNHQQFRAGIYKLFTTFFANTGIAETEVELILSGSTITFCLPFKDNELITERFRTADPQSRQATETFLKHLNTFKQKYFARFPAFGFFDDQAIPTDVLQKLVDRTGIAANDIKSDLHSMVMILPLTEIDKYIVHDLWGHGWQASLFDFELMYQNLAYYHLPFTTNETPKFQEPESFSFRRSFKGQGPDFCLDEEAFAQFVHRVAAERIPVAMSPVLAEMLADVVEFKFLKDHPALIDAMPSSSAFKFMPTKLDLLLTDVRFYFGQATKAFRCLSAKSKHRPGLVAALVALGASEGAATKALDQAAKLWSEIEEKTYSQTITFADKGALLHTNVFTKLVLNFLSIHRAIGQIDEDLNSLGTSDLPFAGWRDLTVIALACFFEENRQENLWRLDEFLTLRFKEQCLQLLKKNRS